MATILSFQLQLPPLMAEQLSDNGGNWQYVGTTAVEQSSGTTVQLIATKRENTVGNVSFYASMLTATIMYPPQNDGVPPQNLTIQGVHDLSSNNETGSVSSASSELADYIGGTFFFDATPGVGVLTIWPPS
jgi:hypothetical protein